MKKVIVTGSAGFIGKALVKRLLKEGVEVIGIDKKHDKEIKAFKFPFYIPVELKDMYHVFQTEENIDAVIHLAAETSVFNTDHAAIFNTNMRDFAALVHECEDRDIKLVYASSSCAAEGNATSFYGLSKRFDEDYARIYLPTATGIRFHNVYGPDPRQGTLLWHLLNDKRAILFNEGRNRRHFTYIDDIIEGILYACTSTHPLLNVCNPEITSTRQFAEIVNRYKPLDIELVAEKRQYDKEEQNVDSQIPVLSLRYTPVEIGIKKIFED